MYITIPKYKGRNICIKVKKLTTATVHTFHLLILIMQNPLSPT